MDLIFVTEFGRPVNVNSLVYQHFKPILKRAGLPNIRLYDLRHTAATLALTVGVSPKVVSEQLGHSSAACTLDVYSHVLPHMQDDAAAKVEAALFGQPPGSASDISPLSHLRGLPRLDGGYAWIPFFGRVGNPAGFSH